MARLILLDSGPLGMIVRAPSKPHINEQIAADLYDVLNPSVFTALDKYEEFFPDNAQVSLYRRKVVHLGDLAGDAWVYISVGENRA
jgi:hypothetical protein